MRRMLLTRPYALTIFAVLTWCPIPPSNHPSFFIEYSERHLLSVLEKERCSMAEKFALFSRIGNLILA